MLLMAHSNPARLDRGVLLIDRKCHAGMQEYVRRLTMPVVSIHPYLAPAEDSRVMDLIEIPAADLGYQVETIEGGLSPRAAKGVLARVDELVAKSRVVYGASKLL